jgi:hypothetical protein
MIVLDTHTLLWMDPGRRGERDKLLGNGNARATRLDRPSGGD